MELVPVRHLWGIAETWEDAFPRIRTAGYRAIEAPVPAPEAQDRFRTLLAANGFDYIALIYTAGFTVAEHVDSFRRQVAMAREMQPLLINSHSGHDAWDEGESHTFFDQVLDFEASLDVPVAHETHRGRILYNPWATRRLLRQYDRLRLCCDFSHWVCVCERLIDSEIDIIRACAARCIHLHARVGYEEGPQVPDPRAPEYLRHVEAHERWWRLIWEAQAALGRTHSTLTPEYGPPDYLHTLPYTRMPVVDLWEICDWQAQRATARFGEWRVTNDE